MIQMFYGILVDNRYYFGMKTELEKCTITQDIITV